MYEDPLLKISETQAELDKLKKQMEEIRKQNKELTNPRNNSVTNGEKLHVTLNVKKFPILVDDFQMKVSRNLEDIREAVSTLSIKGCVCLFDMKSIFSF